MENKIKRMLARLDAPAKDIDELKTKLSTFWFVLVETFNLEKCMVLFHEANPILDRFVVASPESDYEDVDEEEIIDIEDELTGQNNTVTVIPIMYKSKKIGALLLLRKKESIINDPDMATLNDLAGKCAEAIARLVVLKGRVMVKDIIMKIVSYKNKRRQGFPKENEIIFNLLMRIVRPTRVYIACQIDDGSYIYNQFLAADGIIEDKRNGTFKPDSFKFMIDQVKKDEPGITEIEIRDQGKVKGMLMVAYEQSGSVFAEEIERILLVLSSNFASLVELNHQGELTEKERK